MERKQRRRKLKTQPDLLHLVLTVFDVLHQTTDVSISHSYARVPHPVGDQDLARIAALQDSFAEAAENVEASSHLPLAHFRENRAKAISGDISWIEHRTVRGSEEKAIHPAANEITQDSCSIGVNIDISASRLRFEMLLHAIHTFLPLLPNIDDRTISLHVHVDFEGNGFRDTHSGHRAEEIEHLVLSFCL